MIAGRNYAGKDTVGMLIEHFLDDHSLPHIEVSSPIGDVIEKIRQAEAASARAVIVRGGRSVEDLEILRAYEGWLIGVEAPALVRYKRAKPQHKHNGIPWRDFVQLDRAATEGGIDALLARADIVFRNGTSSLVPLYDQVRAWLPEDL